ncbi:zinc finger protein ZAT4-like [Mangifera indica]|uniref:zinc finger protein ZAT4-like n=1 Tax=Mangifera indica TaxID=29780 RepID=UPI001CFB7651|nr:zinc finger protein ZAT4-like [Mangifera indica]
MEKHACKLCLKSFSNGRALGGHMRSHMLNLPVPPRQREEEEEERANRVSDDTESTSSSDEEEGGGGELEKGVFHGLRENPKRSIRLVDSEFSFALDAGSVVLQDRESETESSKNPTRRRSKRTRKLDYQYHHHERQQRQEQEMVNRFKFNKLSKTESWAEPEPVSSISDTTTEEDVAFCLMMLSRDKWKRKEQQQQRRRHEVQEEEEEEEAEKSMEETDESDQFKSSKQRSRGGKYKCDTCKKVFKSYQALGGHRASHKKIKFYSPTQEPEIDQENAGTSTSVPMVDRKIHECPVCFRVFSSGQALGGHKRTHVTGLVTTTTSTPARSSSKLGENLIDLNLPAPIDDDDINQIELSAVSDAEFVNHIKR